MKRLYLSGPMTGIENHNRPAFCDAAQRLLDAGYAVTNPALLPAGKTWEEYMACAMHDLPQCSGLAYMPGCWKSGGARREIQAALVLGMEIASVDEWIRKTENKERHAPSGAR